MSLCWKCREDSFKGTSTASPFFQPYAHCHHEEPEEKPHLCKLKDPKKQCVDYEMKVARNWCKDCLNYWAEGIMEIRKR